MGLLARRPLDESWTALAGIPVGPSGVITAAVPFFYRLQDAVPPVSETVTTTSTTTSSSTVTPTTTSSSTTASPSALAAGDIAIIGYSCDPPDSLHWVNLVDLPGGTTIYFTQNGYSNAVTAGFSNSENSDNFVHTYGAFTPAGTIVANTNWGGMNNAGDNVFAYQNGVLSTANLLYGLVANGATAGWGEDVPSAAGADLPPTLVNGATAVAIVPEVDNAHFNISVLASGSRSQWLAAIGNAANWLSDNGGPEDLTYPTGTLTVVAETTTDTSSTSTSSSIATTTSSSTTAPPSVPLAPDDVAVVRVDAGGETFTVVALRALSALDVMYWTDNGWSNNTFRLGEGGGTTDVILNTWAMGQTFEVSTSGLNASGEQLFLFRGTLATPTLLYGVQWGSAGGWTDEATSPSTSADPALTGGGLNDEHTVELGTGAAWRYTGVTSGTRPALLSAIADAANWTTNAAATWTGGDFTVAP